MDRRYKVAMVVTVHVHDRAALLRALAAHVVDADSDDELEYVNESGGILAGVVDALRELAEPERVFEHLPGVEVFTSYVSAAAISGPLDEEP